MIGVAGRDELERFKRWVVARDVEGFEHIVDLTGDVWREFDITTQPAFAFINDDGTFESRLGRFGLEGLTERVDELIAA